MKKLNFILLFICVVGWSQTNKKQIKTIYETENLQEYPYQTLKYQELDKKGNKIDEGFFTKTKAAKFEKIKENTDKTYDKQGNLLTVSESYKEGIFNGFLKYKKNCFYKSDGVLLKEVYYEGRLDTLDAGFDAVNQGKKPNREFLDYSFKTSKVNKYGDNGNLILEADYDYSYKLMKHIYDDNNVLTKSEVFVPKTGAEKFKFVEYYPGYPFTTKVEFTLKYDYLKYDKYNNWTELKVYKLDNDTNKKTLYKTINRVIVYY